MDAGLDKVFKISRPWPTPDAGYQTSDVIIVPSGRRWNRPHNSSPWAWRSAITWSKVIADKL
jgi:hypothetical protein